MGTKPSAEKSTKKGTADRRVLRTRQALRAALVALLLEKGWDALTVQDVCERANVGRSTFYIHFADKEELLISGFADLRAALRAGGALQRNSEPHEPLSFSRGLLEHVGENRRLFRALVGKRSAQVVQRQFRRLVLDLVREDLERFPSRRIPADAAAHFLTGGLIELVTWWTDGRADRSVEDIEQMFLTMSRAVLRSLER